MKVYEFSGKKQTLKEWAFELGLSPASLSQRLKNWPPEKAFTMPRLSKSEAGRRGADRQWGTRRLLGLKTKPSLIFQAGQQTP